MITHCLCASILRIIVVVGYVYDDCVCAHMEIRKETTIGSHLCPFTMGSGGQNKFSDLHRARFFLRSHLARPLFLSFNGGLSPRQEPSLNYEAWYLVAPGECLLTG